MNTINNALRQPTELEGTLYYELIGKLNACIEQGIAQVGDMDPVNRAEAMRLAELMDKIGFQPTNGVVLMRIEPDILDELPSTIILEASLNDMKAVSRIFDRSQDVPDLWTRKQKP